MVTGSVSERPMCVTRDGGAACNMLRRRLPELTCPPPPSYEKIAAVQSAAVYRLLLVALSMKTMNPLMPLQT